MNQIPKRDQETARGGKTVYGIPVGIIMLDTQFPRVPGDVGNATTWPFPVMYRIVSGAGPDTVVRRLNRDEWLQPFIDAAQDLERSGVELITTNCGFLVLFQREIQEHVRVPVLTSSLLQVPWISRLLPPGRCVGIMTIEGKSLTRAHLDAAGIPKDLPIVIQGLENVGGYFTHQLLGNRIELDVERSAVEHEEAARLLVEQFPEVGAIVLECTNMPPYARRIHAATGRPVFDLTTLIQWVMSAIVRRTFQDKL